MQNEKRSCQRLTLPRGYWASYVGGSGAIRDVSIKGVRIADPEPLTVGTRFDLRLHLDGEVLSCCGVVRRAVAGRGMGVELVDMMAAEREGLRQCLFRLTQAGFPNRQAPRG